MPYVESPLDRIVNVNWGGERWTLEVNFAIEMDFIISSSNYGLNVTSNITVPFPITYTNLRDIGGPNHEDSRQQLHTDYPTGVDHFDENMIGNHGAVSWEQARSFKSRDDAEAFVYFGGLGTATFTWMIHTPAIVHSPGPITGGAGVGALFNGICQWHLYGPGAEVIRIDTKVSNGGEFLFWSPDYFSHPGIPVNVYVCTLDAVADLGSMTFTTFEATI